MPVLGAGGGLEADQLFTQRSWIPDTLGWLYQLER